MRWFSPEKGFGFIKVESYEDPLTGVVADKEFFCHFTGIRGKGFRNLKEGQSVNFEIVEGPKGDQVNDAVVTAEPESAVLEAA